MTINVFYSWQSDTEAKFNRSFIEDCIKKAIKKCKTESKIHFEIALDRDTKGKIGSPDISNEIFKKIANSQIVIGDVTIVNSAAEGI